MTSPTKPATATSSYPSTARSDDLDDTEVELLTLGPKLVFTNAAPSAPKILSPKPRIWSPETGGDLSAAAAPPGQVNSNPAQLPGAVPPAAARMLGLASPEIPPASARLMQRREAIYQMPPIASPAAAPPLAQASPANPGTTSQAGRPQIRAFLPPPPPKPKSLLTKCQESCVIS